MRTTITSSDFRRDGAAAMRAAERGPGTITDHGRPSHVLLTVEDFARLTGARDLMGARLWENQDPSIEFDPGERRVEPGRPF